MFWLNTPSYFTTVGSSSRIWSFGGYWLSHGIFSEMNTDFEETRKMIIRPSVSLKKETNYISGDGTKENPYIAENITKQ